MKRPPSRRRPALSFEALERRELLSLSGTWIGQDGHDLAGGPSAGAGNGIQDFHIALSSLPASRSIVSIDVTAYGSGEWDYNLRLYSTFSIAVNRSPSSTTADLFFEPYQVETGRSFHGVVKFDNESTDTFDLQGGGADPNLWMPGLNVAAGWIGQDGHDFTGPGPSVGPDGFVDAHLTVSNLYAPQAVTDVTVTRSSGIGWSSGLNPNLLNNAEFDRGSTDPSRGDLYLNPDSNLAGQTLTVTVTYANGKLSHTTLTGGLTDPKLADTNPFPASVTWSSLQANWLGQDGVNLVGPGDVHLDVSGLTTGRSIVSAMLTDEARVSWFYTRPGSGVTSSDPNAKSLGFRAGTDPTTAALTFQPVRDETGATLTLLLTLDDGSQTAVRVAGGTADPGLRAADISTTTVVAYPGDDLNALANTYGTVRLVAGLYPMSRPLVLNHPVTIVGNPGTTLLFMQGTSDPTWTAAVKVLASHTTLDGFAVRFAGPVRWTTGISYGPAVIGTTDNFDPWNPDPLVDLTFTHLDLKVPPATSSWEEAPELFRLSSAANGRIADNLLKGGTSEFFGGPWTVTGNTYLGTVQNTYANAVFAAHYTHDVTFSGNTANPVGPSGKTWRFLVMTQSGNNDSVLNNNVAGIGPMDADTVANPNAPEVILTESYRLHYEGQVASVSADGWVVQTYPGQGDPAQTGDVLGLLTGSQAGQWRLIAQVIGPNTYLLNSPIAPGKIDVSVATGFVNETYQGNTIDASGSSSADPLVLVGNQYGAKIIGNTLIGGNQAFRITAAPTEGPNVWGWSHAPFLGATITGNTVVNSLQGGLLDVERSGYTKSGSGRVEFSGTFQFNTGVWDSAGLERRAAAGLTGAPVFVTVGNPLTADPGEVVLTSNGNQVSGPSSVTSGPTFQVDGAILNGLLVRNQGIVLPTVGSTPTLGTLRVASSGSVQVATAVLPPTIVVTSAAAPAGPRGLISASGRPQAELYRAVVPQSWVAAKKAPHVKAVFVATPRRGVVGLLRDAGARYRAWLGRLTAQVSGLQRPGKPSRSGR